jgi:probable rRNA maturation factor
MSIDLRARKWRVHLAVKPRGLRSPARWVQGLVRELLLRIDEEIPSPTNELSIVLTNDRVIRELNCAYRKKDKATDVLSFPQAPVPGGDASLGDLVISVETARRQAQEHGITFREEMARLIVHGVLHLCGYDHENVSRSEASRMRRKEKQLLELLASRV